MNCVQFHIKKQAILILKYFTHDRKFSILIEISSRTSIMGEYSYRSPDLNIHLMLLFLHVCYHYMVSVK